jgi:hypothetical protein
MTTRVPVAVLLAAADTLRSVANDLADARGWTHQRDALDTVATAFEGQEPRETPTCSTLSGD